MSHNLTTTDALDTDALGVTAKIERLQSALETLNSMLDEYATTRLFNSANLDKITAANDVAYEAVQSATLLVAMHSYKVSADYGFLPR